MIHIKGLIPALCSAGDQTFCDASLLPAYVAVAECK